MDVLRRTAVFRPRKHYFLLKRFEILCRSCLVLTSEPAKHRGAERVEGNGMEKGVDPPAAISVMKKHLVTTRTHYQKALWSTMFGWVH